VPGYTDQQEHLHQLGAFVKDMKNVEKIEIQPYHKLGKHKYEALGWQYQLEDVEMNTAEQLTKAKKILSTYGKEVVVN
jgi:pyruvate formate lyase activating enzyme